MNEFPRLSLSRRRLARGAQCAVPAAIRFLVLVSMLLCGFAAGVRAQAPNLVTNGDFETITAQPLLNGTTSYSYQISNGAGTALPSWTVGASGIDCLDYHDTTMCGPGYSSPTQPSNVTFAISPGISPTGGNYIAGDASASYHQTLSQTINGLVINQWYTLSFYQAGAQQQGYVGATTDQWQVTFGTAVQSSTIMNVAQQSDAPWNRQTMFFQATAVSQTLQFLALGTPANAQPPFALLDGIVLKVPEPESITLVGFGILGVLGLRRRRFRGVRAGGSAAA